LSKEYGLKVEHDIWVKEIFGAAGKSTCAAVTATNPPADSKYPRVLSAKTMIEDVSIAENQPIIEGLLRRGEVGNIIASPKARKSWLVMDAAISLEHGTDWLGFHCRKSRVLIIDNELHLGTFKKRLKTIYESRQIQPTDHLEILSIRGLNLSIDDLPELLENRFNAQDGSRPFFRRGSLRKSSLLFN